MTNEELSYLAGIVDGEGTISLTSGTNKPEHGRPFVQVANTNYKLAEWIKDKVKIKAGFFEYDRHPETQKPSFLFQWRGSNGAELLRLLVPFLVLKREQAELVLALWEGEEAWNKNKRGKWCSNNPMPEDLKDRRIKTFVKIRMLNKKGPVVVQENIQCL